MRIGARHWTLAGAAAMGLHAAVAVVLHRVPPHPAVDVGGGGVQVMLAPAVGPTEAAAPAGPQEDAARVTATPAVGPASPPVEAPAKPAADAVVVPKVETVEVAPPAAVASVKPAAVEPVRPDAVPPPRPEAATVPAPEPERVQPPEARIVVARDVQPPPTPRLRPEPPKRSVAPPGPAETRAVEAPPAAGPVSAAAEVQGQTGSRSAGGQPAPAATGGAPTRIAAAPGGVADYMSRLRAWLEQHKEYPGRARRGRIEGTALLVFVMDRDGRVLSHRIERSAGDPTLDRAVEEMIERAQPLPAIPDSFQQTRLEVRVPVQFLLR